MTYRVCIPTAGTGSRLGELTRYVNKSLVSIANRPTLCHLIEQFADDVEFVIALGHKGHLVREFIELTYPQRIFFFVDVSPFEGPGSGLGLTMLACKQHLQQPFVFLSCDTLVDEPIPAPDRNWMAFAESGDLSPYRTLLIDEGVVRDICEKGEGSPSAHRPYIGLAGIYDHQAFWSAMEQGGGKAIETGEAHGLRALLNQRIDAVAFTWHDTGNMAALNKTRDALREAGEPNILEKANEAIWFIGDHVVKFSDDAKFIANRVKRVAELKGFVPDVTASRPHMYCYNKVPGRVLSEIVTLPLFQRLLEHSQSFWVRHDLSGDALAHHRKLCDRFYREKTQERVQLFYSNFDCQDGTQPINGVGMPTLGELFGMVDWAWLSNGLPGRFHGDFHFENILWDASARKFTFLDWRQDFGGDLSTGDIYYDLAKLLHGLIISHELIARECFWVQWSDTEIRFDFHRKQMLVECERHFGAWISDCGYDRRKVWVLTALVYLNIAALHHHPYSLLLYALGKSMLFKELSHERD
ncbi:MAG: phosphotransferase [Burkholderiales bacterium]|nr:phosphotransferase [Burkholderiales bacterium]